MKIETNVYVPGYIHLVAKGVNEFTKTGCEFITYNDKGCAYIVSPALYDDNIIRFNFRPDHDYLVKVTYGRGEAITVFSEDSDGEILIPYESESPKDKGTCVMYRRANFSGLVCTIDDGYDPVRTFSATGISFQFRGAE